MLKSLKKAKEVAVNYPKIFSLIIIGIMLIGLSGVLIFHPLSQFEVFMLPSVWNSCDNRIQFYTDLKGNGFNSFAQVPATDFFYHGTVGQLTDMMEAFLAIGWVMGMVGVGLVGCAFIMLINENRKTLRKQLNNQERTIGLMSRH